MCGGVTTVGASERDDRGDGLGFGNVRRFGSLRINSGGPANGAGEIEGF
jgi:hypothetical protein